MESALHHLVGRIEKALDAREYCLGIFFHIEGAFENTSCESIRLLLSEWKVHRSIRYLMVSHCLDHRVTAATSVAACRCIVQKIQVEIMEFEMMRTLTIFSLKMVSMW